MQRPCSAAGALHRGVGIRMAITKRYAKGDTERTKPIGYQVSVSRINPVTGKQQRRIVGTYTRWKAAKAKEGEALRDVENGVFEWEPKASEPAPTIPTVRNACETWIRIKSLDVTPNHLASYEGSLKNHVGPAWGDMLVTELTHDAIQNVVLDWSTEIEDERKAKHPQTIARALNLLQGALDRQMRSGVIAANPVAGIRKPSVTKGKKDVPQWTADQVAAFFEVARAHDWAPAFWLGELEGLRRAEILGLRWQDIRGLDQDGPVVASIAQTVVADQRNGGRALIQPKAKTRSSERAILLTGPTVEALKRHRDTQRFTRKSAGDAWQDHDLVICNEIGEPIRPAWFTIQTKRMVKEAGLPELTPHALRHHALTRLLREGVSPALAAQKAGHSDVGLVYRTYGHLIQSDQSAANAAIEKSLDRAAGGEK